MIKKRYLIFALSLILLFAEIFFVNAAMHPSTEIIVSFGTCKVTLKNAIDLGYFKGVTPTNCLSTLPSSCHTADKILITVGGYKMTLQEAVDNNVFRNGATRSYTTTLPAVGHLGSEIEVSTGKSLQDSINVGEFSSACTPGTTRTKDCDYLDTTCRNYNDVTQTCQSNGYWNDPPCNSYTNAAKGTTPCDGTDMKACDGAGNCLGWAGTGCGSCPWGNTYYTFYDPWPFEHAARYCNLNGNQGRFYKRIWGSGWTSWSYDTKSARCWEYGCTKISLGVFCRDYAETNYDWQIKP
jgi:hypothetical protein